MRLRNKKTGEIYDFKITPDYDDVMSGWKIENKDFGVRYYSHLDELNEEWEEYKEPKEYWYIEPDGALVQNHKPDFINHLLDGLKAVGNYFETKEEAEKAVKKLKAWKRLKDGGITFKNWTINQTGTIDCFATWGDNIPPSRKDPTLQDDLDLLFSGDEE